MDAALAGVLDALARAVDDQVPDERDLGTITLHAHQLGAIRALRAALTEFGGALLADEPGLGKTFTALGVARDYNDCLVVAPASLRDMWRDAAHRAGVVARFVSFESLSRGRPMTPAPFLIVDEAHHAANARAKRHTPLAALAAGARVLLLTATPVRNRRSELDALLGLFLGSRAAVLDDATRSRCVIRRTIDMQRDIPTIKSHIIPRPQRGPPVARALRALPPPLPLTNGRAAGTLVAIGLARCWASSLASLERALTRRIQRGLAMRDLLESGRRPTHAQLRAWVVGDDATQLALSLDGTAANHEMPGLPEMLAAIVTHVTAIRALRGVIRPYIPHDTSWRAGHLRTICKHGADSPVVAFTVFEATAGALYRELRLTPGVVLLTGRGAQTAGGPVRRAAIIELLGPAALRPMRETARFTVRLVISTDVLSEGVNLQRASAVVHLDEPWTPAAVAQRTGRVVRIGSTNPFVSEHRFVPPRAAEQLLRTSALHRAKDASARRALNPSGTHEQLRASCAAWLSATPTSSRVVSAAAYASAAGFIVRIESSARAWLVGSKAQAGRPWRVTDDPALLLNLVRAVSDVEAMTPGKEEVSRIGIAVYRWLDRRRGALAAGASPNHSLSVRRALSRLDSVADAASPSRRPSVAAQVGRLRAMILETTGGAVELHLRAMLGRPANDHDWLDEFGARIGGSAGVLSATADRPVIATLLILRTPSGAASLPVYRRGLSGP